MTTYTLTMVDDSGGEETRQLEADTVRDAADQIRDECNDWVVDGDWAAEGTAVPVNWWLYDENGDEIDSGHLTVDVEPDHYELIRAAGGDPDCDHDWSSEGEGGCDENPGVWSLGGTAMKFRCHCTRCGLIRVDIHTGSQRNPGECDTVKYSLPELDD